MLRLGEYRWPVRVVDWTRERQRTANLAANNPHTAGEFTVEVEDILAELEGSMDEDMFAGLRLGEIEFPEMSEASSDSGEAERWGVGDEVVNAWFVVRCPLDLAPGVKEHLDGLPDGVTLDSSV